MSASPRWTDYEPPEPVTITPDAADGYNPGPELAATHDGITLTVQRTHLYRTSAVYYWRVMVEGHSIPMADGTYSGGPDKAVTDAARDIAWQLYAGPLAVSLATVRHPITWWNGAITDAGAATMHIIHQGALT